VISAFVALVGRSPLLLQLKKDGQSSVEVNQFNFQNSSLLIPLLKTMIVMGDGHQKLLHSLKYMEPIPVMSTHITQ
jgi:hypothetical protein